MQCKQHFNYRLWYFVIVWNENFVLVFINFIIRFNGLAARAYKFRNVVKFHPTQTRTVGNGSFFSRIIEPTYYRQEHAIAWWPTVPPRNKYYFSIWWWLIMSLLRWEIICLASHNHSFVKWHIIIFIYYVFTTERGLQHVSTHSRWNFMKNKLNVLWNWMYPFTARWF